MALAEAVTCRTIYIKTQRKCSSEFDIQRTVYRDLFV